MSRPHVAVVLLGRGPVEFGGGVGFWEHVPGALGRGLFGVFVACFCHGEILVSAVPPKFNTMLLKPSSETMFASKNFVRNQPTDNWMEVRK